MLAECVLAYNRIDLIFDEIEDYIKDKRWNRLMRSDITYDLLYFWSTFSRDGNGQSRTIDLTTLSPRCATYIIAAQAPILPYQSAYLLPQRWISCTWYPLLRYSTTEYTSAASLVPYVTYSPSLLPHPAKSNAQTFIRLFSMRSRGSTYILLPPLPWR